MNESPDSCRVYYLKEACEIPYSPGSEFGGNNHQVTVFGKSVTCVDVNRMAISSVTELLVSDSFGPCVPVIAIGKELTSLGHFNGLLGAFVKSFSESCKLNQYNTILVIQRESSQKQQFEVSTKLFETFGDLKTEIPGLKVELVEVPLNGMIGNGKIGVMVIGLSVLVYPIVTDEQ